MLGVQTQFMMINFVSGLTSILVRALSDTEMIVFGSTSNLSDHVVPLITWREKSPKMIYTVKASLSF